MESLLASPVLKSFVSGSLSGFTSTIVFQPFDLVKTRIQTAAMGNHQHTMHTNAAETLNKNMGECILSNMECRGGGIFMGEFTWAES